MKLSIVIPAYNERETIEEIIRRVQAVSVGAIEKEIIIVDDGSTDGTNEIVRNIPDIRVVTHKKNIGKGGAVKTGFRHATGDILLIQDADLEYDPKDYGDIIDPIVKGYADITNGVRIQPPRDARRKKSYYWISWLGSKFITVVTNILYWHNAGEYEGCYKAFRKSVIDTISIETNDFDFDNELICKLLRKKIRIVDVSIHYYPRDYGDGKKIRFYHGVKILRTIIKWRFKRVV
ncbi:MAG: glycosyltransferase family 2 protein [Candidatus Ryanbacteria bacterium]|nr:glycosyltransferase family 2 protein [Candidatus Ryanbacteria bacterium]